jgi:beta-lactamase regulating signal transducer with metallopeptidase domain
MGTLLEIGVSNAGMAAFLALPAAAVGSVCRRPAVVHCLWLLVLLKLVTPPLFRVPISLPVPGQISASENTSSTAALPPRSENRFDPEPAAQADRPVGEPALSGPVPAVPDDNGLELAPAGDGLPSYLPGNATQANSASAFAWWPEAVGLLWLGGSLALLTWMVLHIGRFQRLLRSAQPAPAELQHLVMDLGRRLGLARCPRLWLVPGAVSPMLWPVGRDPRLLFPARLLDCLDREQLRSLLLHELAHYRRRDHWVRFVELAALCLYWWHPVVWWARRELHEAEEQCCDAWVVWTLAGAGRAYALALLQTVALVSKARSRLPVAASGIGLVPHLRRRLTMIMLGKTPRSLSWASAFALLGVGVLLLPLRPVRAQDRPKPRPDPAAARDNRQEQIELLKKAIAILEEQGRTERERGKGDRRAPERKPDDAEIQKARAEVKALTDQVEVKRKELRQLEERLRAALLRLSHRPETVPVRDGRRNF